MPSNLISLPSELQRQILSYLYQPWYLRTESVPAFSRHPVYTFTASSRLESGPALACRTSRDMALSIITEHFSGVLDASDAHENYSIIQKYKYFLSSIHTLVLNSFADLATMGRTYQGHLQGLKTIKIASSDKFVLRFPGNHFDHIWNTRECDRILEVIMERDWAYWMRYNELVRNSERDGIDILYQQRFTFMLGHDSLMILFEVKSDAFRVVGKTKNGKKQPDP